MGCRVDRTRDWATRIAHEATLHDENVFLTLTYSDEYLPDDYSVSARPLQLFMKRLRKAIAPVKVRFFACGEYGDDNGRPHYHAILFGYGFPDKTPWRRAPSGHVSYRSALLESLWINTDPLKGPFGDPLGHAEIGTVTRESGGYVARYVTKKQNGDAAVDHYQRVHAVTGELCWVNPEFMVCSTRPGIGADYADRFAADAFPSGFLVHEGQKTAVPRYYARRIKSAVDLHGSHAPSGVSQSDLDKARRKGKKRALTPEFKANATPERLGVRQESLRLKLERLKRDLDAGKDK